MKSRMMISVLIIALVAAVIGGGTMAWFTAKASSPAAEFTAGTVRVDAGFKGGVEAVSVANVNPGDCICVGWEFTNTGSKSIMLRFVPEKLNWEPSETWLKENWEALCFSLETPSDVDNADKFWAWFKGLYWDEENGWDLGDVVEVYLCPNQDWKKLGDYYYYDGVPLGDGETGAAISLCVYFKGAEMDNKFQEATFQLAGYVEAIQASNNAPNIAWLNGAAYDDVDWDGEDFDFSKCNGSQPGNGGNGGDVDLECWFGYWELEVYPDSGYGLSENSAVRFSNESGVIMFTSGYLYDVQDIQGELPPEIPDEGLVFVIIGYEEDNSLFPIVGAGNTLTHTDPEVDITITFTMGTGCDSFTVTLDEVNVLTGTRVDVVGELVWEITIPW